MKARSSWTTAAALTATLGVLTPTLSAQGQAARPAAQGQRPAAATAAQAPAPNPKLDGYKKEVVADVENMSVFTQQMIDQVFSFGELGFQEF